MSLLRLGSFEQTGSSSLRLGPLYSELVEQTCLTSLRLGLVDVVMPRRELLLPHRTMLPHRPDPFPSLMNGIKSDSLVKHCFVKLSQIPLLQLSMSQTLLLRTLQCRSKHRDLLLRTLQCRSKHRDLLLRTLQCRSKHRDLLLRTLQRRSKH
jgi:hypothetical protein